MQASLLKEYVKNILKTNKKPITKLHVFDFDSTLFKTSRDHKVNIENSDHLWIEDIVKEAKQSISDPDILCILCTARKNKPNVRYVTSSLLKRKGLRFDKIFFKPGDFEDSTPQYKRNVIERLLNTHADIVEVKFWDDREDNLNAVDKLINQENKFKEIKYFRIKV